MLAGVVRILARDFFVGCADINFNLGIFGGLCTPMVKKVHLITGIL
jgi:hypothetical protein